MTWRPLALALLFFVTAARAEPAPGRVVVLIGGGPVFREAVTVALAPWDLRVAPPTDMPAPSSEVPRAAHEARAITDKLGATGLVWVGGHDRDHALFVYDSETDQLVTRALAAGPPFDGPAAASAALTVKTLLRSSTVAPPPERLGAIAPSAVPTARAEAPPLPPPRATPEPRATIEVSGAARAVAADVDTRIGLGLSYWFDDLGIALAASAGPGLDVSAARFRGRFDEIAASPTLRYRLPLAERLRLEPRVGVGVHATKIDGVSVTANQTTRATTRTRFDGSTDVGVVLDFALTKTTRLGLDLGGSWVLRYQRYLVGPVSVLALTPLQGSAGLRLAVGLP